MNLLGAHVIRTPTELAYNDPGSHIEIAKRLHQDLDPSFIPNQYSNPANPNAHFLETGPELWKDTAGKIDVIVAGAGTGGTITGVARFLKSLNPKIRIFGVDPKGSLLSGDPRASLKSSAYFVEGIGYDFIPEVLDKTLIDGWEVVDDCESFLMARRLVKEEGLLCGGSSGSVMAGALKIAKKLALTKYQRMVVILPDSIRNYMSKLVNDNWMIIHGFLGVEKFLRTPDPWKGELLSNRILHVSKPVSVIAYNTLLKDHLKVAAAYNNVACWAVIRNTEIVGVWKRESTTLKLLKDPELMQATVQRLMDIDFRVVSASVTVNEAMVYVSTGFPVLIEYEKNLKIANAIDFVVFN